MSLRPVAAEGGFSMLASNRKIPKSKMVSSTARLTAENSKEKSEQDYDKLNKDLIEQLHQKLQAFKRNQGQSHSEFLSMANKLDVLQTKCTRLINTSKQPTEKAQTDERPRAGGQRVSLQKSDELTRKGSKDLRGALDNSDQERGPIYKDGSTLARMPKKMLTGEISNTDQPSVGMFSNNADILNFHSFRNSPKAQNQLFRKADLDEKFKKNRSSASKFDQDKVIRTAIARQRTHQDDKDSKEHRDGRPREKLSSDTESESQVSIRPVGVKTSQMLNKRKLVKDPRSIDSKGSRKVMREGSRPKSPRQGDPSGSKNSVNHSHMTASADKSSQKKLIKQPIPRRGSGAVPPKPPSEGVHIATRKVATLLSEIGYQ